MGKFVGNDIFLHISPTHRLLRFSANSFSIAVVEMVQVATSLTVSDNVREHGVEWDSEREKRLIPFRSRYEMLAHIYMENHFTSRSYSYSAHFPSGIHSQQRVDNIRIFHFSSAHLYSPSLRFFPFSHHLTFFICALCSLCCSKLSLVRSLAAKEKPGMGWGKGEEKLKTSESVERRTLLDAILFEIPRCDLKLCVRIVTATVSRTRFSRWTIIMCQVWIRLPQTLHFSASTTNYNNLKLIRQNIRCHLMRMILATIVCWCFVVSSSTEWRLSTSQFELFKRWRNHKSLRHHHQRASRNH